MLDKSSSAHRVRVYYHHPLPVQMECHTSVAPLGVPHVAMKETQLQGFTIPKVLHCLYNYVIIQFKQRFIR